MILGQIFQSMQSWRSLSGMKMRPQVAFKVLRYTRDVEAEFALIEKRREAILREVAGVPEGEVKLEPDTPEVAEFQKQFTEDLLIESELKSFDRKLSCVLEMVGDGQDDVLTMSDLAMLEPFFQKEDDGKVKEPRDIIPISGS